MRQSGGSIAQLISFATFLLLAFFVSTALAVDAPRALPRPSPAQNVADIDEHLGAEIPRGIILQGELGEKVTIGDLVSSDTPVILVLAYYRCPMLCPLLLSGLSKGLSDGGFSPGKDYRLVTVSIDPEDTPEIAKDRRDSFARKIGIIPKGAIRFLVGSKDATRAVADAVGFRYAYDPSTDQYAHPAAAMILSKHGRISRYLYGLEHSSRDLRLALVEAAEGKVGNIVDRVLLTCYRYDPQSRKYMPYIVGFFRIGSFFILCAVGSMICFLRFREWQKQRRASRQ